MKYWFYSEGNILGPYDPAEMLALPAFAEESLVCAETATGDNPGDWRPAAQVAEIASALSVGAGRAVTAGVMAGAYEYETGFNASARYFEDKEPAPGASYGELLDTIDNILGAYKEGKESPSKPQETDYDLAEKFDIRLSRIQEELEAARWEKNLLLEKMRMKEMEEKKNRERINELEARLKSETGRAEVTEREVEQVRHLSDLKEKAETIRKIEEIKREELSLREDAAPAASKFTRTSPQPAPEALPEPAAEAAPKTAREAAAEAVIEAAAQAAAPRHEEQPVPELEVKALKSMARSSEIKLETSLGAEVKEPSDDAGLTSRKLRSLGQTQTPAYVYGSHYDKPLPGPEAAPPGAFKGPESFEPLPQQAGGLVYDFTVVTAKSETSQQFKIEPRQEIPAAAQPLRQAPAAQPAQPPVYDFGVPAQQAPAPQPQVVAQHGFQFQSQSQPPSGQFNAPQAAAPAPAAQQAPAAQLGAAELQPRVAVPEKGAAAPPADTPEKTQRIPVAAVKGKADGKPQDATRKKGGKLAFIAVLVIFGSIAAGGLGYFFMGEGVSFSEFSMLDLGGKKKSTAMTSQLEAKAPVAKAEPSEGLQPAAETQPAPAAQPQPAPEAEKPVNENIRKALLIVKEYKLSGGRGTVATWFANSFLSGAAGGSNEEWTATPLHGDILVVQYRLLRPKQDPLIYQFEVDAAKQDIVRGINNSAIELLDFSSREKSAAAVKKPAPKPRVKKPSRPKELPILPLPDAPAAGTAAEPAPTGFENAQAEGSEEVKYLKAQESDEELF